MPIFETSRKVQVFGSSLALTLPAFFTKANSVKKGQIGKVFFGLDGVLVACWSDEPKVIIEGLMDIINNLEKFLNENELSPVSEKI